MWVPFVVFDSVCQEQFNLFHIGGHILRPGETLESCQRKPWQHPIFVTSCDVPGWAWSTGCIQTNSRWMNLSACGRHSINQQHTCTSTHMYQLSTPVLVPEVWTPMLATHILCTGNRKMWKWCSNRGTTKHTLDSIQYTFHLMNDCTLCTKPSQVSHGVPVCKYACVEYSHLYTCAVSVLVLLILQQILYHWILQWITLNWNNLVLNSQMPC